MEPRNAPASAASVNSTDTPLSTTPVNALAPSLPAEAGSFTGLFKELNDNLEVDISATAGRKVLKPKSTGKSFLPGQPRVRLSTSPQPSDPAHNALLEYLRTEHLTDALDELLPYMRYIFVGFPCLGYHLNLRANLYRSKPPHFATSCHCTTKSPTRVRW